MAFDLRPLDQIEPRSKFPGVTERVLHEEPGMVVKGFEMDAEFRTGAHSHPEIQIMVVTEGELRMVVEGEDVAVPAGSALTIPGGAEHRAWSPGGRIRGLDVIFRSPSAG